ncbi:hypothetical protein [Kibdelosporangium philippinense]|uniref:hypothetical protein n=1 Tax=Kibdelosporangium philippinense TaxID=211113 RepID=UPI00360A1BCD
MPRRGQAVGLGAGSFRACHQAAPPVLEAREGHRARHQLGDAATRSHLDRGSVRLIAHCVTD